MKTGPELLYLDLLKRTLTFSLWPAPPVPVTSPRFKPRLARWLLRPVAAVFRLLNLQIGGRCRVTDGQREEGRAWPEYAHTMIGLKRLDNLQDCIETVLRENVPGDFIETGVWRGGACIFMRAVLAAYGVGDRKVLVADSFNGFPDPDVARYPADGAYGRGDFAFLAVSRQEVEANFRTYGLLDEHVVFLQLNLWNECVTVLSDVVACVPVNASVLEVHSRHEVGTAVSELVCTQVLPADAAFDV